ncbi:MAG: DUF4250 domain-containing protein [Clostridia bacterium]|nr:DUF4250 domain-containing protein [Clostridia bacterium]
MTTMLPNDPVILLSVINTRLRDYYSSLDALCEDLNVNKEELEKKLSAIGYFYKPERNQFV